MVNALIIVAEFENSWKKLLSVIYQYINLYLYYS